MSAGKDEDPGMEEKGLPYARLSRSAIETGDSDAGRHPSSHGTNWAGISQYGAPLRWIAVHEREHYQYSLSALQAVG